MDKKLKQVLDYIKNEEFDNEDLSMIGDAIRNKLKMVNSNAKQNFSVGMMVKVTHPNWPGGTARVEKINRKLVRVRGGSGIVYSLPPRFVEKL